MPLVIQKVALAAPFLVSAKVVPVPVTFLLPLVTATRAVTLPHSSHAAPLLPGHAGEAFGLALLHVGIKPGSSLTQLLQVGIVVADRPIGVGAVLRSPSKARYMMKSINGLM